jgi:hypothetical protein
MLSPNPIENKHTKCTPNADLCRFYAEMMQNSIKVCVSRTFLLHTPSMHNMNNADFVQTFADIKQTEKKFSFISNRQRRGTKARHARRGEVGN